MALAGGERTSVKDKEEAIKDGGDESGPMRASRAGPPLVRGFSMINHFFPTSSRSQRKATVHQEQTYSSCETERAVCERYKGRYAPNMNIARGLGSCC